jgi:hypothetical protein
VEVVEMNKYKVILVDTTTEVVEAENELHAQQKDFHTSIHDVVKLDRVD